MPFNAKQYMKTKFQLRTEEVPVPELAVFFCTDEELAVYPRDANGYPAIPAEKRKQAVWKVRGLTGQELGRANEAATRNKQAVAILEALASKSSKETTAAAMEMLGIGAAAPADVAKRIEHLVVGSVDPVCTQELAVKLCETKPIEFWDLTNAIVKLTGLGQMPGKPEPSGAIPACGPASASPTPEGVSSTS
jgi:hypothetical protein